MNFSLLHHMPGEEFFTVFDASHYLMQDTPVYLATLVEEFLHTHLIQRDSWEVVRKYSGIGISRLIKRAAECLEPQCQHRADEEHNRPNMPP